jgi:hypothetical protein
MKRSLTVLVGALLPLLLAGCLDEFKTPSAYQEQRYLCGADSAADFQALAETCKANHKCFGAFSMQGQLQGEPLTVATTLSDVSFTVVQPSGMSDQTLDRVNLNGASPYFTFVFHMKSIGGVLGDAAAAPRTLQLNAGATSLSDSLADDQINVGQLLEAGGASADEQGLSESGTVDITTLTSGELAGTFQGTFGSPADAVTGCFDAIPAETTINFAPSQ